MVSRRERLVMLQCLSQLEADSIVVHEVTVRSFDPISYRFLSEIGGVRPKSPRFALYSSLS